MKTLDIAVEVALRAHFGQVNKYDNEPYILHPHRVSMKVRDSGWNPWYQAAAWLHDVIEDSEENYRSLCSKGLPKEIAYAVDILSKRKDEPNEEYYRRVVGNDIAKIVKKYDIEDNFSRNHLISNIDTRLRMAKKYSLGLDILSK